VCKRTIGKNDVGKRYCRQSICRQTGSLHIRYCNLWITNLTCLLMIVKTQSLCDIRNNMIGCSPGVFSFSYRQQLSKFTKENESSSCEQKETSESKPREEMALPRREIFQKDELKYATILTSGRERRSKFEELQAASKNLERRLHEDDDYCRRQEMDRRINKDKPPRYNMLSCNFLLMFLVRQQI